MDKKKLKKALAGFTVAGLVSGGNLAMAVEDSGRGANGCAGKKVEGAKVPCGGAQGPGGDTPQEKPGMPCPGTACSGKKAEEGKKEDKPGMPCPGMACSGKKAEEGKKEDKPGMPCPGMACSGNPE